MINPKVKYGDIFSLSQTGHEIVVCQQAERKQENKNLFFRADKHGYDFTVRAIEFMDEEMNAANRLEGINKYFEMIYVLAKPFPAHTYFTVRIPYLFCSESEETWKHVAKIINEKLVYRNIPVEIWMTVVDQSIEEKAF